jgi:hypothetical protein
MINVVASVRYATFLRCASSGLPTCAVWKALSRYWKNFCSSTGYRGSIRQHPSTLSPAFGSAAGGRAILPSLRN